VKLPLAETLRIGARVAAGPLALAAFFLPWAHGSGLLAGYAFSGFDLVGFAGRVEQLDLGPFAGGGLWLLRALLLGVAVAAVWLTLLAPLAPRHPVHRFSGWYLALLGVALLAVEAVRGDLAPAPTGLVLWLAGVALFVLGETLAALQTRRRRSMSRSAVHGDAYLDALTGEQLRAP
jgi:hypothetical protein